MLTVMAVLIITGSFGFLVWQDLLQFPKRHHLSLHTHLVLRTGAVIFVISVLVYFLTEHNLGQFSRELSYPQRIFNTIFMAITPRTAGLVTIPYTKLSAAGISTTIILMFIGGAPGSTAGGDQNHHDWFADSSEYRYSAWSSGHGLCSPAIYGRKCLSGIDAAFCCLCNFDDFDSVIS